MKILVLVALLFSSSFFKNSTCLSQNISSNSIPSTPEEQFRLNLYGLDKNDNMYLLDGTLTLYSPSASNNIDGMDARKMFNSGENISMKRGTYDLIIERRNSSFNSDTIFFRMWGMQKKMYQMEFSTKYFSQTLCTALLQDKYLKTSKALNLRDTTRINFLVNNDPASYAQDRFIIVLKSVKKSIPFGFTLVNSNLKNEEVNITWKSQNQDNIKKYCVERSADNKTFKDLFSMNVYNVSGNDYHWTDNSPLLGNNYYRIRILRSDNTTAYSNTTKANVTNAIAGFSLFPNPATAENLNLKIVNQPEGSYQIQLINSSGQIVLTKSIYQLPGFNTVKLNSEKTLAPGIYHLLIFKPSGTAEILDVVF
jgi:hypothetical protein